MPPARASWKGQIRLSLVSLPVELFPATRSTAKITFNQIHEPTGKRVRYEKVVDGVGPVDRDEIMKGFEYEKGTYVLLSDEEIDEVKLESRKTFELTQFVPVCDIDPIYFDRPYFVVPSDDLAEDAFRVVRDALRETQMAGLGQLALRGREYIGALKANDTGMVLETLRYAEEIRKAAPYFSSISDSKADPEMLSLAKELIARKEAPFDPEAFKDRYTDALRELIDVKLKSRGRKLEVAADEPRPQGTNVVDLMAALKQSIEKAPSGSAQKTQRAAARKKTDPRSTAKKPAKKKSSKPSTGRGRKSA